MKTVTKAYLLYFFFGMVGAHRFYTGNTKSAWFMIALSLTGFVTYGMTWFVLLLWVFIDLFRIPEMVRWANTLSKAFPFVVRV